MLYVLIIFCSAVVSAIPSCLAVGTLVRWAPLFGLVDRPNERNGASPELLGRLPVFSAMVVWLFIGDGLLTFLRRACKREKVWAAHRSHLYQRLVQIGWSHAKVALLYGLWAVISAAIGLAYLNGPPGQEWAPYSFMPLSLLAMFAFVSHRERLRAGAAG